MEDNDVELQLPTQGERNDESISDLTKAAKKLLVNKDDMEVVEEPSPEVEAMDGASAASAACSIANAGAPHGSNLSPEEAAELEEVEEVAGNSSLSNFQQLQPAEDAASASESSDSDSLASVSDPDERKQLLQQYALGRSKAKKKAKTKNQPKLQSSPPDETEAAVVQKVKNVKISEPAASPSVKDSDISSQGACVKTVQVLIRKESLGNEEVHNIEPPIAPAVIQQQMGVMISSDQTSNTPVAGYKNESQTAVVGGRRGREAAGGSSPASRSLIDFTSDGPSQATQIYRAFDPLFEQSKTPPVTAESKSKPVQGASDPPLGLEAVSSASEEDQPEKTGEGGGVIKRKKPKTPAQLEAARRRRHIKRDREKAAKAANPPPPPPPVQTRKRKLALPDTSCAKQGKPSTPGPVKLCEHWLDGGNPSNIHQGSDLIDRHGPISHGDITSFSSVFRGREGRREVEWVSGDAPSPQLDPLHPHGLRMHVLRGDQILSAHAFEGGARGAGTSPDGQLLVHSTRILEKQRAIDMGPGMACLLCSQPHLTKPPVLAVLVCSNEAVASAGLPHCITSPGAPLANLPEFRPEDHFEILMLRGGVQSSPREAIDRLYGTCRLPINFILNLGGEAVTAGESSNTVFSDIMELRRYLVQDFRRSLRVATKVFLASPLQWAGEGHLFLDRVPQQPLSYVKRNELALLARQIEQYNDSLVAHNPMLRHSMPRWGEFVTQLKKSLVLGNFGRQMTIVEPVAKPSAFADAEGGLHLDKLALYMLVKSSFTFMKRADTPW